jgi:hypothetical protein
MSHGRCERLIIRAANRSKGAGNSGSRRLGEDHRDNDEGDRGDEHDRVIGQCKRALHHAACRSSGPPEVFTASSLEPSTKITCRFGKGIQRADHRPGGRAKPAIGPAPSRTHWLCRRSMLSGHTVLIASARAGSLAAGQTLKISHQFPGGTIAKVDGRDRLCKKFASNLKNALTAPRPRRSIPIPR